MRHGLLKLVLLFGIGMAANVQAQDQTRQSLLPSVKLQVNKDFLNPDLSSTLSSESDSQTSRATNGTAEARLRRYDAIFYYPLHRKGVTFDLGLNIRLQEIDKASQPHAYKEDWLNIDPEATRTRIHAAAIFDLPFDGLKAGVSGSYEPSIENFDYDYQAKLSYKWKNGFGLEGGWLHQQKPLEQQNLNDSLDEQTLFLDLNYRF